MQLMAREVTHKVTGVQGTATGGEGSAWWIEWEDGNEGWHQIRELWIDSAPF